MTNRVTIILPVSREQHLLKVFTSLENMECDRERTGLLAFVDGAPGLYLTARNLVEQSKFAEHLCVHGSVPGQRREYSINTRRRRIAAIHNEIRKLIKPCEYVFLIEDDGVLPPDALGPSHGRLPVASIRPALLREWSLAGGGYRMWGHGERTTSTR